jgi:hypothetical protein
MQLLDTDAGQQLLLHLAPVQFLQMVSLSQELEIQMYRTLVLIFQKLTAAQLAVHHQT